MPRIELRDYQRHAIDCVHAAINDGHRALLGVAATGAGKTNILLEFLHEARAAALAAGLPFRALVIAHRKKLITQPAQRAAAIGVDLGTIGIVQAETREVWADCVLGTVQSLHEDRVKQILKHGPVTHIVTDEAHHAVAPSYMRIYEMLRAAYPDLVHFGVTATPMRADERGLAEIYTETVFKITMTELMQKRWLTGVDINGVKLKASFAGVKAGKDYSDETVARIVDTAVNRRIIVAGYQQFGEGRPFIAFCATVEQALHLSEEFNANGILTDCIHAKTPERERERIDQDYKAGRLRGIVNVGVLTEGYDAPNTGALIMARPTKAEGLYTQMLGRGLRPKNGKAEEGEKCIVLDFVPVNSRNLVLAGDVLGMPKPQQDAAKELIEKLEDGEEDLLTAVQYSFDGDDFEFGDAPIELIAFQLDYLKATRLAWYPPDALPSDLMSLGLGKADDGFERVLAIHQGRLFAIWRKAEAKADWQAKEIAIDGNVFDRAEQIAAKWGVTALSQSNQAWRTMQASDAQLAYLKRLKAEYKTARADLASIGIELPDLPKANGELSKGAAASLITHIQAVGALRVLLGQVVAKGGE